MKYFQQPLDLCHVSLRKFDKGKAKLQRSGLQTGYFFSWQVAAAQRFLFVWVVMLTRWRSRLNKCKPLWTLQLKTVSLHVRMSTDVKMRFSFKEKKRYWIYIVSGLFSHLASELISLLIKAPLQPSHWTLLQRTEWIPKTNQRYFLDLSKMDE